MNSVPFVASMDNLYNTLLSGGGLAVLLSLQMALYCAILEMMSFLNALLCVCNIYGIHMINSFN